jgi:hypothetical protein
LQAACGVTLFFTRTNVQKKFSAKLQFFLRIIDNRRSRAYHEAMKNAKIISFAAIAFGMVTISLQADDVTNAPAADASMTAPASSSAAMDTLKPAMSDDDWRFGLTVPLWAPGIDGNVTVAGRQQNVNVNFGTLKDHLDTVFSTALEAHKGKYSIYGDVGYMKFSISSSHVGPDGHVHVNSWAGLKFLYSDLAGGYQLIKTVSDHPFLLEGTVGVRYWYASIPVTFSDDLGNTLFAGSKTWNLVDPVLGFRGTQYFTQKFHLDFHGDGGGFNISHDTDWTWSANAELSYDFAKWFTLSAGYQALALDESENNANGKTGVNLIFNGVLMELNFRF